MESAKANGHHPEALRATPVLKVADYPRARDYYTDILGFEVHEEGGDPPRFGILDRDRAVIFLDGWHEGAIEMRGGWDAYIHVRGLDRIADEIAANGGELVRGIETTVYGMREFEVMDPDGNLICFGEDADAAPGG
jgi:catechol 2,3-dioxygenase-like lactoylglutathione lyase family enzyme